ncbi:ABC transporter substrate-binding protein [Nocardioides oleivorans]|uniref:ABC transporter substrate-binding protein n=1 Tax=Nocardioides oleivorans TaxID=273676 RepID=A0A4Q2RYP7_9ACTN|nr:ABC transporter substrate-binding protein [Nocardioides oleivorans]RYB93079.1 ABC transporter substrate-binding protein [Nocardioides oleivorans]
MNFSTHRRARRGLATALVFSIASLSLAACGGGGDEANADGTASLSGVNGDPSNGPSGAPFGSVQIEEGWDKADGYTLKWDVAQSAAAGLQLLSAGKVDISQGSAPTAYAAAKLDPDLRIIGFLNGPAYLMVAPEGSGIATAADLEGKKIGVLALGSASDMMVRGSLQEVGLDPDKDVKILPIGVGAPMAEALNSGTVDAIAGWEGMWQSISALTDEPLAPVEAAMSDLPGMMLQTTTQEVLDTKHDLLVDYMRNFYKSCQLGADDPQRVVADHWEKFSNVAPPADKYDEQLADQADWNQNFFSICAEPGSESGMAGVLSESEVKESYDWLRKYNILEDDVDFASIVDTSVTEEAMKDLDLTAWSKDYLAENPTQG